MSEFTVAESTERLIHGIKKAASLCVEMGKAQDRVEWFLIAQQLNVSLQKSKEFIIGPALTKQERHLWLEKTKDLM